MPSSFKDHFSAHADAYRAARPTYPPDLFTYLATLPAHRQLAWDCGCGNGQAAQMLKSHFPRVLATDASAAQLTQADAAPGIHFAACLAEQPPLADATVDLLTVAQAMHWFDFDRFHTAARRVLRPSGVLAIWAYGLQQITPDVDAIIRHFYDVTIGPYWPIERRHVDAQYRTIPFPWREIPAPTFHIRRNWTLNQLLDYLATWSAVKRYQAALHSDPLPELRRQLARVWIDSHEIRPVHWPLYLRIGCRT